MDMVKMVGEQDVLLTSSHFPSKPDYPDPMLLPIKDQEIIIKGVKLLSKVPKYNK